MTTPTIDAPPPPPDPIDPRTFASRGVVFARWLATFRTQLVAAIEYIATTIAPLAGSVASAAASADSAAISAGSSQAQALLALSYSNAAQAAAGVYDTIAEGRAAVLDGGYFKVIAGGSDMLDALTLFRRDSSSTETAIMEFADAADIAAAVGSAVAAANSAAEASDSADAATAARDLAQNYASALIGTSETEIEIGLGTQNLTIEAGKQFAAGQWVVIARTADVSHHMIGQVTSYDSGTGALEVEVGRVSGSGTYAAWTVSITAALAGIEFVALPVFSAEAAALRPLTQLDALMEIGGVVGGSAATDEAIFFSSDSGLFIVNATGSNIYTSPDGDTWTARSMPSSQDWSMCMDLTTDGLLFAYDRAGTATAYSDDGGVTWTGATALPNTGVSGPARIGNRIFVRRGTVTDAYWSDDKGTSWNAATMPVSSLSVGLAFGGVFTIMNFNTLYTSATGATGSWTDRSGNLPAGATGTGIFYDAIRGKAAVRGDAGLYNTDDFVTWTLVSAVNEAVVINGVGLAVSGAGTFPSFYTVHVNGEKAYKQGFTGSSISINANFPHSFAYDPVGELVVLGPLQRTTGIGKIDVSANGPTSLFYGA